MTNTPDFLDLPEKPSQPARKADITPPPALVRWFKRLQRRAKPKTAPESVPPTEADDSQPPEEEQNE